MKNNNLLVFIVAITFCGISQNIIAEEDFAHRLVYQVDLFDNFNSLSWSGVTGTNAVVDALGYDGDYLYVGSATTPAVIAKLDPVTMTTVSSWTGASGQNSVYRIIYDGTYLYAALRTWPARIIKIDPATMATVAVWTGVTGQDDCKAITLMGGYLYASFYPFTPAQTVKIDKSTMTTLVTHQFPATEISIQGLTTDGYYLYPAVGNDVYKLDPRSGTTDWGYLEASNKLYNSALNGFTNYRVGQYISGVTSQKIISRVDMYMDKVGAPTGTGSCVVRDALTHTIVGTLGTVDVTTLPTSPATPTWVTFNSNPIVASGTIDYVVCFEWNTAGGDIANYPRLRYNNTNSIPGQKFTYYDGSWHDTTLWDSTIRYYVNDVWAAGSTDYGDHCIGSDGLLYVSQYWLPSNIIKIDTRTMQALATLTVDSSGTSATIIRMDGEYIYTGTDTTPGIVYKIRASDMRIAGVWTAPNTYYSHIYDVLPVDPYIFISFGGNPGRVIRRIMRNIVETGN